MTSVAAPRVAIRASGWVVRALCACTLVAGSISAQVTPKSQLGSISQMVAGTRIEIVYRRPVARGRTLFGSLVPWGNIWTPGADSATRISVSGPITVNGTRLEAGTYSLWAIPDSIAWTVIFNRVAAAFHLRYPVGNDALRVRALPRSGEPVETLSFDFPLVDADSALLELHWGTTIVPITIHVLGRSP